MIYTGFRPGTTGAKFDSDMGLSLPVLDPAVMRLHHHFRLCTAGAKPDSDIHGVPNRLVSVPLLLPCWCLRVKTILLLPYWCLGVKTIPSWASVVGAFVVIPFLKASLRFSAPLFRSRRLSLMALQVVRLVALDNMLSLLVVLFVGSSECCLFQLLAGLS